MGTARPNSRGRVRSSTGVFGSAPIPGSLRGLQRSFVLSSVHFSSENSIGDGDSLGLVNGSFELPPKGLDPGIGVAANVPHLGDDRRESTAIGEWAIRASRKAAGSLQELFPPPPPLRGWSPSMSSSSSSSKLIVLTTFVVATTPSPLYIGILPSKSFSRTENQMQFSLNSPLNG